MSGGIMIRGELDGDSAEQLMITWISLFLSLSHKQTNSLPHIRTHNHTCNLSLSHTPKHTHFSLSLPLSLTHTQTLSLALTRTHTLSLSLSLSLYRWHSEMENRFCRDGDSRRDGQPRLRRRFHLNLNLDLKRLKLINKYVERDVH